MFENRPCGKLTMGLMNEGDRLWKREKLLGRGLCVCSMDGQLPSRRQSGGSFSVLENAYEWVFRQCSPIGLNH